MYYADLALVLSGKHSLALNSYISVQAHNILQYDKSVIFDIFLQSIFPYLIIYMSKHFILI